MNKRPLDETTSYKKGVLNISCLKKTLFPTILLGNDENFNNRSCMSLTYLWSAKIVLHLPFKSSKLYSEIYLWLTLSIILCLSFFVELQNHFKTTSFVKSAETDDNTWILSKVQHTHVTLTEKVNFFQTFLRWIILWNIFGKCIILLRHSLVDIVFISFVRC